MRLLIYNETEAVSKLLKFRVAQDHCKKAASLKTLSFAWHELALEPFCSSVIHSWQKLFYNIVRYKNRDMLQATGFRRGNEGDGSGNGYFRTVIRAFECPGLDRSNIVTLSQKYLGRLY